MDGDTLDNRVAHKCAFRQVIVYREARKEFDLEVDLQLLFFLIFSYLNVALCAEALLESKK